MKTTNLTTEGSTETEEAMFQLLVEAIEDHETLPNKISEIRRDGSDVIIESDELDSPERAEGMLNKIRDVRAVQGDDIDGSDFVSVIRSVIPSEAKAQAEEWMGKNNFK